MSNASDAAEFLSLLRDELGIEGPVTVETPLITSGLIDSFDIVSLLAIIESRYQVAITAEELDVTRFDSPAQMLAFIEAAR